MSEQAASYRRILKSSSIIGGASVINILIGLVRIKFVALWLGPAGIGLVSLYSVLLATASTLASMGVGTVATRQVAEALSKEDAQTLAVVRRSLSLGVWILAGAGALAVWSLREVLAIKVLGGVSYAGDVGWLALGVALSVAASLQTALLQGMRRMGDMALLSVLGAVLNTVLGMAVLWQWKQAGLLAFVVAGPLVNFVLGYWFVGRVPKVTVESVSFDAVAQQWRTFLRLGVPFMGAGLVGSLVQLWMRVEVGQTLGAESLGHFQAAWTISMQYIGFVLAAMGADYYPRLAGVMADKLAATRLVNEQTEISLLLSAPIFIAVIGVAPWVIQLLYSSDFSPAVAVLRWQVLGDVLKVASWPLGFVIVAAGAGATFFWTESLVLILMGGLIAVFTSVIGLQATGIAFLISYMVYLPIVFMLANRRIGFLWTSQVATLLVSIFCICILVFIISVKFWFGPLASLVGSMLFAVYSFGRISKIINLSGRVGRLGALANRITTKMGIINKP
ncbi:O-antigen translocase [Rhodoferax sp. PAMC 29310]|uniref:O-antigen translocase n=1 Tax=Rhodoferax sp. PAMC 29310 TaxID=2822760 RepID=UPI001B31ED82|nr:O-antigen translocase [Rhodoferax sp. PAMC 29310]